MSIPGQRQRWLCRSRTRTLTLNKSGRQSLPAAVISVYLCRETADSLHRFSLAVSLGSRPLIAIPSDKMVMRARPAAKMGISALSGKLESCLRYLRCSALNLLPQMRENWGVSSLRLTRTPPGKKSEMEKQEPPSSLKSSSHGKLEGKVIPSKASCGL